MLLAMMAAVAAGTALPAREVVSQCRKPLPYAADTTKPVPMQEARPKRLDQLPPANLELTVLRTEDGCIVPVIVRYGVGAGPKVDR